MVKFTHLISKERDNNKCYVKYVLWKVFKDCIKLLASPSLVMLQTFFTQRALKGKLGTRNWALEGHFKVLPRAHKGHLDTRALERHLGTRALEGHLGTRELKAFWDLATGGTRDTLADSPGNKYCLSSEYAKSLSE